MEAMTVLDLTRKVHAVDMNRIETEGGDPATHEAWLRTPDFMVRFPEGTDGHVVNLTIPALKAEVTADYAYPQAEVTMPDGIPEKHVIRTIVNYLHRRHQELEVR